MPKPFIICIVDDDDICQFTVVRTIEAHGLAKKILSFSDGEEAISFLLDNKANKEVLPDVILLDINMPIMDGWEFLEEYIKMKPNLGKKITIYMVSSSVDVADIERARKISEVSDYIVKPITTDKLKEIIQVLEMESDRAD